MVRIKHRKDRKPTETDWVGMRMLYFVLCADGSASTINDVNKTITYFNIKLGSNFERSMAQIVAEHARLDTFKNPASAIARKLDKSIEFHSAEDWSYANNIKNGWIK